MKTVAINIDGVIRDFITKFDFMYRKKFIHNPGEVEGNIPTHADIASGNLDENSFQAQESYVEKIDRAEKLKEEGEIEEAEKLEKEAVKEVEALEGEISKKETALLSLPVDTDDLTIHYKFDPKKMKVIQFDENIKGTSEGSNDPIKYTSKDMLEKFIYEDYPFQIFGRAESYQNAMELANRIQAYGRETGLFKTVLVSTCKLGAIPATFAFLSTHHCRVQNIHFVEKDEDKWNFCDVLIDDSPKSIHSKPEDKEIIKIDRPWNKWDKTKYQFESLEEVHKKKVLDEILAENSIDVN